MRPTSGCGLREARKSAGSSGYDKLRDGLPGGQCGTDSVAVSWKTPWVGCRVAAVCLPSLSTRTLGSRQCDTGGEFLPLRGRYSDHSPFSDKATEVLCGAPSHLDLGRAAAVGGLSAR